jgi:hypothetical protein
MLPRISFLVQFPFTRGSSIRLVLSMTIFEPFFVSFISHYEVSGKSLQKRNQKIMSRKS